MNEVALLLPDEKGVAQGREDEASQDLAGAGVGAQEAEAVCQQEDPQAKDGQTLDEGTEPRRAGGGQPQDKVNAGRLKERHQLGPLALHLRAESTSASVSSLADSPSPSLENAMKLQSSEQIYRQLNIRSFRPLIRKKEPELKTLRTSRFFLCLFCVVSSLRHCARHARALQLKRNSMVMQKSAPALSLFSFSFFFGPRRTEKPFLSKR